MSRLIFEPNVRIIGATGFAAGAIQSWAEDHDVLHLVNDPTTPLGRICQDIRDIKVSSLDLMPEFAGRFCYRAWTKGRGLDEYIKNVIESGHGSVLEHSNVTFSITGVSRSFSHELVRHRQGVAISQESQRYVDAKDVKFVVPPLMLGFRSKPGYINGIHAMTNWFVEQYQALQVVLENEAKLYGWSGTDLKKRVNEAARCVLPNMTETRLTWTANLRALRHICSLRGSPHADLEIRRWAVIVTAMMKKAAPHVFADFKIMPSLYENIPDTVETAFPKV